MISEEERAINNLWNSLEDVLFNLTYSKEDMQRDLRTLLNEYNYLNIMNNRKEKHIEQLEAKLKKYELETIPRLEGELSAVKQVHEYDVQMIDTVKRKSSRIIQYN